MKHIISLAVLLLMAINISSAKHYVGGDISLLPEYENAQAQYKTHAGIIVSDILPYLKNEGMNAMRVRLFVNPESFTGNDADRNACQNLEYILPLCRRIKDAGFALMLDFHYSDTWADPAKQWTPKAWENLNDEQLFKQIYDYTRQTLVALKDAGIEPDFIQTGNEISYGMLWGAYGTKESELKKTFMGSDANWNRFGQLLNNAIKACREICPDAQIVIHTERVGAINVQNNFYDKMATLDVDYDIIGLSFYPHFHGNITQLDRALTALETRYPDKPVMIVETGYAYAWEVPGTNQKVDYPYSDAGQNAFAKDLVATLQAHKNVTGLFWWWMEYNAFNTSLSGWYNAPLFDSRTGCATTALSTICTYADDNSHIELPKDEDNTDGQWHTLSGIRIDTPTTPGLYIHNGKVILIP